MTQELCEDIDEKTGKAIPVPCPTPEQEKAREKLPAEMSFDKWVYGGISYFAQAVVGIIVARWLLEGGGKNHYKGMSEWAGKNIISKFTSKTGEEAVKAASGPIAVTTMIMVGNSFIPPVKWLENHKPTIVRRMTENSNAAREARGEVITPEEKQHQKELLHQLDHHPKQTWTSLLSGRAFGLGAVYAVLGALTYSKYPKVVENNFAGLVKKSFDKAGMKSLAKSKTVDDYARMASLDMFYSAVSAGGLYVWSHFIRPPKQNSAYPPMPGDDALAAVANAEAPSETAPSTTVTAESITPNAVTLAAVEKPTLESKQWATDKPKSKTADIIPASSFKEGLNKPATEPAVGVAS